MASDDPAAIARRLSPAQRRVCRPSTPMMRDRVAEMQRLISLGYTVMDAGRELGLNRTQAQDTARKFGLRALHGAICEAKSEAGIRGNQVRWG